MGAGPRVFTMESGDRRDALVRMLDASDVVLMTLVSYPSRFHAMALLYACVLPSFSNIILAPKVVNRQAECVLAMLAGTVGLPLHAATCCS
jgi:hypothetical protein